jgi:hypothetical protein
MRSSGGRRIQRGRLLSMQPNDIPSPEGTMLFVAGALAVLSGLFYAAGNNDIGSLGTTMCQYGDTFCDHPSYVFVGAVLAALWGTFVSIR